MAPERVRLAVVGNGRMGAVHTLNALALCGEADGCDFVAVVDPAPEKLVLGCCRDGDEFRVDQRDALRAMEILAAAHA